MKLLPKQKNAVFYLRDNETTELIYGGAAGGGKSALGCMWLIEGCQKYPGSRWMMARNVLKDLKDTTLNSFRDLISQFGIEDQFDINEFKGVITHINGSQIMMKELFFKPSDPDFKRLGSSEYTGAFIDECNECVFKAWQVVKSRIRYKLDQFGLVPKILGTCNPSKGWVYKYFYKAKATGDIATYRKFIPALPKDNPHLSKHYIESLNQIVDEGLKQRLLNGEWEFNDDKSALINLRS